MSFPNTNFESNIMTSPKTSQFPELSRPKILSPLFPELSRPKILSPFFPEISKPIDIGPKIPPVVPSFFSKPIPSFVSATLYNVAAP